MKKAFTLIELVFVIVIIGILSAVLAPSFKRDSLQEAANQIATHIRYTQQLALHDNKFEPNNQNWYKGRWQIIFGRCDNNIKCAYSIFSDKSTYKGNPDTSEMAINPLNPNQYLSGGFSGTLSTSNSKAMKELNIGKKYDIKKVDFSDGCEPKFGKRISFDYLGRPLKGNTSTMGKKYSNRLITSICNIVLHQGTKTKTISIYPETGFVKIN